MTNDFTLTNSLASTPTPSRLDAFDLHARSGTDVWRKPATPTKPPVESDNAPSYLKTIPSAAFQSVQVTVHADWTRLYDQGGLIFYFPSATDKTAWLKTGIEFYNSKPNLSTVATPGSSSSDWGLVPLQHGKVTIRAEREQSDGKLGPSLWIYMIEEDGSRVAVREVTWAFDNASQETSMRVGAYACRPTRLHNEEDNEELVVHFTDFDLVHA